MNKQIVYNQSNVQSGILIGGQIIDVHNNTFDPVEFNLIYYSGFVIR